jgi:hypothetical protein
MVVVVQEDWRTELRRPGQLPAEPPPRHRLGGLWPHLEFFTENLAMAVINLRRSEL